MRPRHEETLQFVRTPAPHFHDNMARYLTISCLLAVAGVAATTQPLELALQNTLDQWTYPRYAYNYAVNDPHTGDNKAQWEKREGDVVKGSYSLVEPDGNVRVVDYAADDHSGFSAVVKRLGPGLYGASPLARPIVVPSPLRAPRPFAPRPPLALAAWRPLRQKTRRPTRYITITATRNGRKTWIAGPIPVIPGKVFVVKRKH